jgi:hypothetical protein
MSFNMETIKARDRRKVRDRLNQMQRAIACVALAVDGLSSRDRLVVLNEALRQALADDGQSSSPT